MAIIFQHLHKNQEDLSIVLSQLDRATLRFCTQNCECVPCFGFLPELCGKYIGFSRKDLIGCGFLSRLLHVASQERNPTHIDGVSRQKRHGYGIFSEFLAELGQAKTLHPLELFPRSPCIAFFPNARVLMASN